MKIASLFLSTLMLLPRVAWSEEQHQIDSKEVVRRISVATVGEDATSTFYYFFYCREQGETVEKVRILWNGGAQNPPRITDYYLDGSKIEVIERTAKRTDLPVLLRGEDSGLTTKSELKFKSQNEECLLGEGGAGVLSKTERNALANLISALAHVRKPLEAAPRKAKEPKKKP